MTAERSFIDALLDRLLPGNARWPAARDTDAAREFRARVETDASLAAAMTALRAGLASDFASLDKSSQDNALRAFETAEPGTFGQILLEVFGAYYMDAKVARRLTETIGYPGSPPQPHGREMPAFDPSMLPMKRAAVKQRIQGA